MTSSKTLMTLRDLQRLHQAREEAEHAVAVRSRNAANVALQDAQQLLGVVEKELRQDFDRCQFELDRFRILTTRISELSQDVDVRQEELGKASSVEAEARSACIRAERRAEHIEERHAIIERKERRRLEHRSAYDHMSVSPASRRKKP